MTALLLVTPMQLALLVARFSGPFFLLLALGPAAMFVWYQRRRRWEERRRAGWSVCACLAAGLLLTYLSATGSL